MASDKLPNYQAGEVSLNHGLESVQVFQASSGGGLRVSGNWCKPSRFCIACLPGSLPEPGRGFPAHPPQAHADSLPGSLPQRPAGFLPPWHSCSGILLSNLPETQHGS